jgi:hypothetical protein
MTCAYSMEFLLIAVPSCVKKLNIVYQHHTDLFETDCQQSRHKNAKLYGIHTTDTLLLNKISMVEDILLVSQTLCAKYVHVDNKMQRQHEITVVFGHKIAHRNPKFS